MVLSKRGILCLGTCFLVVAVVGDVPNGVVEKHAEIKKEEDTSDPEAPQNVKVTALSDSVLEVTWQPPDVSNLQYYLVKWSGAGTETGNEIVYVLKYNITDLLPCTEYFVTVTAVNGSIEHESDSAPGKTDPGEPPEPRNCAVTKRTSTSVSISWQRPNTNCMVFTYNIMWSWEAIWNGSLEGSTSESTKELTYSIKNISPASHVTISIKAMSGIGYGLPCEIQTYTEEDVPSSPTIVNATVESNYVFIVWDPPNEANGVITSYRISLTDDEGAVNEIQTKKNLTEITLYDVPSCHLYNISVAASTSKGFGMESELWEMDVMGGASLQEVRCVGNGSRNFAVEWDFDVISCDIPYYQITWDYTVLWTNKTGSDEADIPGNSTIYEFEDAFPYTQYDVCLTILDVEACCVHTTEEEAPSPPTIEDIFSSRGNVHLSWSPPASTNGVVRSYAAFWDSPVGGSESQEFSNVTEGVIESLQICNKYSFRVAAFTNEWGEESDSEDIVVANYVSRLNCSSGGSDSVVLWYEFADLRCEVSKRNMNWNIIVLWNNKTWTNTTTVPNGATSGSEVIHNLPPYSWVDVCMSLSDLEEDKLCCTAETDEDVPSEPSDTHVSHVTTTSVVISWEMPHDINGVIQSWEVSVKEDGGEEVLSKSVPKEDMKLEVKSLVQSTKYIYEVKCRNGAGAGKGKQSTFSTQGQEEERSLGLIIGLSVGAVVLVAVAAGAIFFTKRKAKAKQASRIQRASVPDYWNGSQEHYNDGYDERL